MQTLSVISTGLTPWKIFPPLDHYDYKALDAFCACAVCREWRSRQAVFLKYMGVTTGHSISCTCQDCQARMKARSPHLAALNRRDLYCEASWHASQITTYNNAFGHSLSVYGSGMGVHFMTWLTGQFTERKEGWWIINAPYRSIDRWIRDFQVALEASGIGYRRPVEVALPIL